MSGWVAQRRPVHLAGAVVLLAAVVFFAMHPDALVTLVAYAATTAVAVFRCQYGLRVMFAPTRAQGHSRSRRRR